MVTIGANASGKLRNSSNKVTIAILRGIMQVGSIQTCLNDNLAK
jgi:hypothetical protein